MEQSKRKNLIYCILAVLTACLFLFPVYWMFQMSFKTDGEIFQKTMTYYPHQFTIEAWIRNIGNGTFFKSLINSFINALITMIIALLLGVPAAYGIGRYRLAGTKIFVLIFLVTQMLPASVMLTPLYLTFGKLGLLNSHFAAPMAVAAGSIPFIVVTLRPYFKSVPVSLDEAARIDGCNMFQAFIYIMLPAIRTSIITVMVISFLHGWNDLIYSMTFNVADELRPLTANIRKFQTMYGTEWNSIMAYGAILVLPVLILFISLQKYIVGGLTAGAVKE